MFQLLQNKLGYIRTDIYLGAEIRQDLKKWPFVAKPDIKVEDLWLKG